MENQRASARLCQASFILSAALFGMLTGCASHENRPAQGSVYIVEPPVETVVFVQDDYVYYPGYQVYYSNSRRQYAYREGNAWVMRPAPRGVPVNVLLASPSVPMNFHDAPANHHAAVIRQYPQNWAPPGDHSSQNAPPRNYLPGDNNVSQPVNPVHH